ncbi:MAG: hypothetical protein WC250_02425 [Candidatus Paceibacterota bacterium]|jgi:hypothetical protein
MGKLSLKSYIWKCILGVEVIYVLCLLGGYLPWRTAVGTELHRQLFETLPGFVWGSWGSIVLGAVYVLVFAWIFGSYMVWMHNSSLRGE